MADSYNKKERDKRRKKRKQDKAERKKQNKLSGEKPLEFMYLDEDGNLTATPPDPTKKKKEIDLDEIHVSTPKKTDIDQPISVRNGVVKFFNSEKGFGFIKESSTNEDLFVHVDNLEDEIKEHDKVEFEVESGPKGPVAVKVKLIKE